MIAVLDYGIGNLRSAEKALLRVGADARLVDSPEGAIDASGVVLPGVGAFGACARALRFSGLDEAVRLCIADGRPFLGICVGLQLLFEGSEEDPGVPGLAILAGVGARASHEPSAVPQMQWNLVRQPSPHELTPARGRREPLVLLRPLLRASPRRSRGPEHVVGTCDYGGEIAVAFERGNMFGTQFHPEKSATAGLELLAALRKHLHRGVLRSTDLGAVARRRHPSRQVRAPACGDSSPPRPSTAIRSNRPRPSSRPGPHGCTSSTLMPPARAALRTGTSFSLSRHPVGVPVQAGGGVRDQAAAAALFERRCRSGRGRDLGRGATRGRSLGMAERWPGRVLVGLDHRPAAGPDGSVRREVAVRGWVGSGGLSLEACLQTPRGPAARRRGGDRHRP